MDRSDATAQRLYRYRFEDVEFDAARVELRVGGQHVDLEQRPLQVLAMLLERVDEVVPRSDLFERVWQGRPTVDNVLANAVAKLRKALGPAAGARIVNVPRVGYRLKGPVERAVAGHRLAAPFELKAGQPMAGREHFRLHECLDPSGHGVVWRVRHDRTGETRIYKFARAGEQLEALKREVTIDRLLHEKLGDRDDLVRLIDWNFDVAPYWLQRADAGRDLADWACADPAFAASSREDRIGWFLQAADAVAAAHGVGVLHKDLKPSNILVEPRGEGRQLRVTDFGSGRVLDPEQLDQLGITRLGMTVTGAMPESSGVTLLYLAPEVLAGGEPTVRSDVYALGRILFQMMVGDMRRMLASGWEQDIDDELLREDIAAATHGDPERRLASVDALTQRLRSRGVRAVERQRLRESDARALLAERRLERSRARRPWLIFAIVLLALSLGISLWQIQRVRAARIHAQQQAALAKAANDFLNNDLLGAGMGSSPAWNERNPTLREILDVAAPRIDKRFAGDPLVLATLHRTLGRAYKSTGAFTQAAVQLRTAADNWRRAVGASDTRTVAAQYELAQVLARLSRFDDAGALLQQADAAAGARRTVASDIALHGHIAHGDVAYQQLHFKDALSEYRAAEALQRELHPGDAVVSAHLLLSMAGCYLRMGQPQRAEANARKILAGAPYTQRRIGLVAIATARSRLSHALRAQRRYHEAIPVAQKALADYEKVQGADGQGAIASLSSLSYLYSLAGDEAKALQLQREVYQRAARRWGTDSQYTLVELLNLGSSELDVGDVKSALPHLRLAETGLTRVSGAHAPVTQAARVALANALSELGRNQEALAAIRKIDPLAYQATSTDPGRAQVLAAMRARIELRLHEPGAATRLRDAIAAMQTAGVGSAEIAPFREALAGKSR